MKKLIIALSILSTTSIANAYQTELQGTVGYYDAKLNNGNYNAGAQGTYYFKEIDYTKGPFAESAFLNQASSIAAAYNFGKVTADFDYSHIFAPILNKYPDRIDTVRKQAAKLGLDENFQGKADVEQHNYGFKAETYLATPMIPIYASASYNHSKTKAKNKFTSINIQGDDSGDRYALELGTMLAPNFLIALGYTNISAHQSLDTFSLINQGLINAGLEARSISSDKDAFTARTKYVGAIEGTNMSIGFEANLLHSKESMYQFKSDLYITPQLGIGLAYTHADYTSATVPNSAIGLNASYFFNPQFSVSAAYVHAEGESGAKNADLGMMHVKYRF